MVVAVDSGELDEWRDEKDFVATKLLLCAASVQERNELPVTWACRAQFVYTIERTNVGCAECWGVAVVAVVLVSIAG